MIGNRVCVFVLGLLFSVSVFAQSSYVVKVPVKFSESDLKPQEPIRYNEFYDFGNLYDCSEWLPNANSVSDGVQFIQRRECQQNEKMIEKVTLYDSETSSFYDDIRTHFNSYSVEQNRSTTGTQEPYNPEDS